MQPLELVIPGTYWDCWAYRGWLYLWGLDKSLRVYDFDVLVDSLTSEKTRLPLTCAFSQGDYLYGPRWQVVFQDPDVGPIVRNKFRHLAGRPFVIEPRELARFLVGEFESPFPDLHDDCEIYANSLYALTGEGVFKASARTSGSRRRVGTRSEKLWDVPGVSLAASGNTLAIAAASEGLFEMPLDESSHSSDPRVSDAYARQVSARHTTFANWAYSSLYGSSDIEHGYLLAYSWERTAERKDKVRTFVREFDESDIFDVRGLSWARAEKMYCLKGNKVHAVRFTQKYAAHPDKGEAFLAIGEARVPVSSRSASRV